MNDLSTIKLALKLLDGDKPKSERIWCAKAILQNLIEQYEQSQIPGTPIEIGNEINSFNQNLDAEAQQAKRELSGQ